MNKYLALVAILAICGSVFADTASDCAALTTSTACAGNTACKFTSSSTTCTNKCDALSETDCKNGTNSPNCDYAAASCGIITDCSVNSSNETTCKASDKCSWTAAVAASCALKGTALETDCQTKKADQATCEADNTKCAFTAGTFSSCSYKTGQCASKADADCNTSYCNKTPYSCKSNSAAGGTACSTQSGAGNEAACNALEGCLFNAADNTCNDNCTSKAEADCTSANKCTKTAYACADKSSGDSCSAQDTEAKCTAAGPATFCTVNKTANSCAAKATYCSAKSETQCNADTTNCSYTAAVASKCENKVSATTCGGLTTDTTCAANTGCKWTAGKCSNKTAKKCLTTDTQTVCSGADKFCSFTETGTCGVASSSSSILVVFASLVALFALF